jgi:hypothetical protein
MKLSKSLWTLAAACLLAGCATSTPPAPVLIDQNLLQPCPDLVAVPAAEDGTGDPGELALADVALAGQYLECQRLHQGLIKAALINATTP